MTSRLFGRFSTSLPWVDLPSGSKPQYVDHEGYELFEPLQRAEEAETAVEKDAADLDEHDLEPERGTPSGEPLLNLADSLVLSYSTQQTRQHHLRHLLPLVFSHPPVPSYNRPKPRFFSRKSLLGPPPPAPYLPLPIPEYHGPIDDKEERSVPTTPADDLEATSTTQHGESSKPKKKSRKQDSSVPAHEIECMARATLGIGPVSYLDTELWVGRFVEPRRGPYRREKVRKIPADPRPRPPVRPPTATVRPPTATSRPAVPSELIQRVNQAAMKHPWLATIIHRASRHVASPVELSKLSYVVQRLNRGDPIDSLTEAAAGARPLTTIAASTPAIPAAPSPSPSLSSAPPSVQEDAESELTADDESDADMTGPPQEGGGPLPDAPEPAPTPKGPIDLSDPSSSISGLNGSQPLVPPQTATMPLSGASHLPNFRPASPSPLSTPPPPKPAFQLPPPFLLIAFKDIPTEKYLLPLGMLSYISRIGGDHVTDPPPPPPPPVVPPVPPPTAQTQPNVEAKEPKSQPELPAGQKSRTRASLGRNAKLPPPPKHPTPSPEEAKSATPPPLEPENPTSSALDPLPGMLARPGTVLISTFVPAKQWARPEWPALGKTLPFGKPAPPPIKTEPDVGPSVASSETATQVQPRPAVLNLATLDLLPTEEARYPVTIRLEGMNDKVWRRVKMVMDAVEGVEIRQIAQEPDIRISTPDAKKPLAEAEAPVLVPPHIRFRPAYLARKRARFSRLLSRVPPRAFLHPRTSHVSSALVEATSDRFAPRFYPISTKPLYLADEEGGLPETAPIRETPIKRRRGELEPTVAFEMPVDLGALDERVEEGAKFALNRRRGRPPRLGQVKKEKRQKVPRAKLDVPCEGCGKLGLKVWRRGPGGHATFPQGDPGLGELKAPGAAGAHPTDGVDDGSADVTEGDATMDATEGDMTIETEPQDDGEEAVAEAKAEGVDDVHTEFAPGTRNANGIDTEADGARMSSAEGAIDAPGPEVATGAHQGVQPDPADDEEPPTDEAVPSTRLPTSN